MSIQLMKNQDFHVTRSAGNGLCYICNCKKQPGDPGIFRAGAIDWEGQLDICVRCIQHAAHQLGMIDTDRAEKLQSNADSLEAELEESKQLVAEQASAIDALNVVKERRRKVAVKS